MDKQRKLRDEKLAQRLKVYLDKKQTNNQNNGNDKIKK